MCLQRMQQEYDWPWKRGPHYPTDWVFSDYSCKNTDSCQPETVEQIAPQLLRVLSRRSKHNQSEEVRSITEHGMIHEQITKENLDIIRKLIRECTNLNQPAKQANAYSFYRVADECQTTVQQISQLKDDRLNCEKHIVFRVRKLCAERRLIATTESSWYLQFASNSSCRLSEGQGQEENRPYIIELSCIEREPHLWRWWADAEDCTRLYETDRNREHAVHHHPTY